MIVSAASLRKLQPLSPFVERGVAEGMSFGLSIAGYDIRVAESLSIPEGGFRLASSFEEFHMPKNLLGIVHDKSTWARRGLAVQNTVIEPGWKGYLTLELTNHGYQHIEILAGTPIAQILFHYIDEETEGYDGKYQNQERGAQEARFE